MVNTDRITSIIGAISAFAGILGPMLESFGLHGAGSVGGKVAAGGVGALGYFSNKKGGS